MGKLALWLEQRYQVHRARQEQATERVLQDTGVRMAREMKSTHPWTNRTTDAEKSLGAEVVRTQHGAETTFTLRAGYINTPHVSYGIWLELANAGVWAVVRPTVDRYKRKLPEQIARARRAR